MSLPPLAERGESEGSLDTSITLSGSLQGANRRAPGENGRAYERRLDGAISSRREWVRPQSHSPQTFVSFEFDVQSHYEMINGNRWKVVH
jgi:hypothetical protein